MEHRALGKTGLSTSLLGFGGFHLLEIPASEAGRLLGLYLDAGGNYIETAADYGNGESERKIGRTVAHRRQEYILATKTSSRDAQGARGQIDLSLQNLRTDYVDLLLMHAVASQAQLQQILSPGGAYEAALEAQAAGKVRHIGISMHGQPDPLLTAMQTGRFEVVMSTINYYDRFNYPEIEGRLIPMAQERDIGVILMKPLADGYLYRSAAQAFRYAFSRPVSVVVTGINTEQMLASDLAWAEAYTRMTAREEQALFDTALELGDYVCRQCGKCACPERINLVEIFAAEGYYDRQMASGRVDNAAQYALVERLRYWYGNQRLGKERYARLSRKADACTDCGVCVTQCPYHIDIPAKLRLADYKLAGRDIY